MHALRMWTLDPPGLGSRRQRHTIPIRAVGYCTVLWYSMACAPDLSSGYRPCICPVAESNGPKREQPTPLPRLVLEQSELFLGCHKAGLGTVRVSNLLCCTRTSTSIPDGPWVVTQICLASMDVLNVIFKIAQDPAAHYCGMSGLDPVSPWHPPPKADPRKIDDRCAREGEEEKRKSTRRRRHRCI